MMKKKIQKLLLVTIAVTGNDVKSTLTALALSNARKMQSCLGGVQRFKLKAKKKFLDIRRAEDCNSRFEFAKEKLSDKRRFGGAISKTSTTTHQFIYDPV
jgi:hypothetical protein